MKLRTFFFSVLSTASLQILYAQNPEETLVTINKEPYTVEEFERVYTKNLDLLKDDEQKDLDNYMDLFVLYKLKVRKAYELGLDKEESYIDELNAHRKQLSSKYFTDEKKLDQLIHEAYERSLKERNAAHILIRLPEFAESEDTLKAYRQIMSVYKEIEKGKPFEEAAVEYSEDPSAKQNKGDLGYFSVFRMVYPFEQAVFSTPVGKVSLPVRSQFGYHLVKVKDERPARYIREISQIYVSSDKYDQTEAKNRIEKAYKELLANRSFADVANEYSDDQKVGETDGVIKRYLPGTLGSPQVDNVVYGTLQEGEFSQPFQTEAGWYIVKLEKIQPYPTFDESFKNLKQKVSLDERSQILRKDLLHHLKKRFDYKENKIHLEQAKKQITTAIYENKWQKKDNTNIIATFDKEKITANDYFEYVQDNGVGFTYITSIEDLRSRLYDDFISKKLEKYYDSRLENDFPEFRNTMQEYREGLLLFDLMEKEIWNKAKSDSTGYMNYYKNHLSEFEVGPVVEATILQFKSDKAAEKAFRYYHKKSNLKEVINKYKPVDNKEAKFVLGDVKITKKKIEQSTKSLILENPKEVLFVTSYHLKQEPEWEKVKPKVIQLYQEQYEKDWINKLRENVDIHINNDVFRQLKAKYHQN